MLLLGLQYSIFLRLISYDTVNLYQKQERSGSVRYYGRAQNLCQKWLTLIRDPL
jgi:hypothetical protein